MAAITYAKPTWVNGSTVPISAANLQAMSDAVDALADRAWISTTATGGEDGNGGQPPSPKPNATGSSTIGYWAWVNSATTPNIASSKWAVIAFTATGAFCGAGSNIDGNTDLSGAFASNAQMMVYRTS